LSYAPARGRHRRWVKRIVVGLLLMTLGLAAFHWRAEPWRRARMLYYQRQCEAYSPPADEVVFDNDPARSAALRAKPGYVTQKNIDPRPVFRTPPGCWNGYADATRVGVHEQGGGTKAFLHERRTPRGERRLVVVEFFPFSWTPVVAQAIETSPLAGRAEVRGYLHSELFLDPQSPPRSLRIFAGQPDPADASRFTIVYEWDGRRGTIDGRLNDDDTIVLTDRDGLLPVGFE
jgi:hypothetical protein